MAEQPTNDPRRAVYVISVAADLAGVHPQTLRIYERRGLLDPQRTQGGSRRYSDADIDRLQRISELTASGLNLEGVKRVMDLEDEIERLQGQIDQLNSRYRRDLVPYSPQNRGRRTS
jgi:MerR family transcriptional regulator, heat shock protein HspR